MKVDVKIVPIKEKTGIFSSKEVYQLQVNIQLTDVETATIKKAGLKDFVYMSKELAPKEQELLNQTHWEYSIGVSPQRNATMNFNTLIEAQAGLADTKARLTQLKNAMELSSNAPTEDSFEL